MEWRVPVVNALIHRIALSYKLKVFCSNVPPLNNKYWSNDLHLSDDGLRLFIRSLEDFLSTILYKNPIQPQFLHQQNDVPAGESVFFIMLLMRFPNQIFHSFMEAFLKKFEFI